VKPGNTLLIGLAGVLAFISVLALGAILSNGSLPWAPDAKIVVSEQPTAKIDIEIHKGEVLMVAYDQEGKTTREPGILEVTVLRLDDFRSAQDASYTQVAKQSMNIDKYDLIYINNYGDAENVYAAHTGLRINGATTLYNVWMTFYPKDAGYSVFASTYTPGST
jgi:hypothetical protein